MRFIAVLLCVVSGVAGGELGPIFPGETWERATPGAAGLEVAPLDAIAAYLGGRGCIVRHGYLVYTWGDAAKRGDVASAAKTWYSTLLFRAVEEGRLASVDTRVAEFVPGLEALGKDGAITFAHMANQVSCYGVMEAPGTAFDYNDWQMALFVDMLVGQVYGAEWPAVDAKVLTPMLAGPMQCEDAPTMLAFGLKDRAGRLGVSPRDFARLGWLFLNGGRWGDRQLLPRAVVRRATRSPLPNSIPRTRGEAAPMLPGQRTMGSRNVPDNQTDHYGSYSFAWWLNGVDREGRRRWPDAPVNVFTALGHKNGQRGMAVLPDLDLVISWNDTTLGNRPGEPHPLNEVFRLLGEAAADAPMAGQIVPSPGHPEWLARNEDKDGDGELDAFFMCGPGDPEGFLYRGARLADGTRDGDQDAIIDSVAGTGANCLYLMTIRSHGGDGGPDENPFVDSDPKKGVDEDILKQWEQWFTRMDDAGIVIYLFIYDDAATIWRTGDAVGPEERDYLETLVRRFAHHKNLIWCLAEEYQERFSPARARAMAKVIRDADAHNHVIAVHKLDGLDFGEFADDPNIDEFSIQYNRPSARELHDGVVQAWHDAAGRYHLNLSEDKEHGFGLGARQKTWAVAMAGACSMAIEWSFDTPDAPSREDLEACGHLVRFMERIKPAGMAPIDNDNGPYVLGEAGRRYAAYLPDASKTVDIRSLPSGFLYKATWYNPASGRWKNGGTLSADALRKAQVPGEMMEDAAVYLECCLP